MLFDTHCHIFDMAFNNEYDEVYQRCQDMKLMIVGFNEETNKLALEFSEKYHSVCSVGVHPSDVDNVDISYFSKMIDYLDNNHVKAIGECGLDYYWHSDNKEKQKEYFIRQIEMSIKYDLPLIIHVRDAIADAYEILSAYKGKIKGVMHSFSGSLEMALLFIDLGLLIGLGGPVTYKNAVNPKKVASMIPLDKLLIETDCPYLPPVPYRGKRNEPSYVKYTCECIATLRNVSYEEIERETYKNGIKLFNMEDEI